MRRAARLALLSLVLVSLVSLVLGAASCAAAQAQPADRRVAVDPTAPPWSAVAKVQTTTGGRCTGVLIAPATVLSAAHCLYNPRTRTMLPAISLHVLFGYQRAAYRWHRTVVRTAIGPGFDPDAERAQPSDWVLLRLDASVPVTPLPLLEPRGAAGKAAMLAGYNQDRAQLLMADPACHVLGVTPLAGGGAFVWHDCAGTRGTSGGPLLTRDGEGWGILGINIAVGREQNLALAPRFAN